MPKAVIGRHRFAALCEGFLARVPALTGCAFLLACAAFSRSAGEWPAERFGAIDNVCAWPNLTLLKNGAIISIIFNRPAHGLLEGDLECWASEDSGRSWRLQGVAASHEPGTSRMHAAAGLAQIRRSIVRQSLMRKTIGTQNDVQR